MLQVRHIQNEFGFVLWVTKAIVPWGCSGSDQMAGGRRDVFIQSPNHHDGHLFYTYIHTKLSPYI